MNEELQTLYKTVFDENGNVKLCRREACKDLIEAFSKIFPEKDFGNQKTGYMNVDVMHETYYQLLNEKESGDEKDIIDN